MRVSQKCIDLIKEFEGLELEAYLCPAGIPTIGYGVTGPDVKLGMKITKLEAEQLLLHFLPKYEKPVLKALGESANDLKQEEFDAMVSLCYNIGAANFTKSSVVRHFKAGNRMAAANAFELWNKAKVKGKLTVLKGLARRRAAEKVLFLSAKETTQVRQTQADFVEVPESSVAPDDTGNDKSLIRSKEVIGGGVVSIGGLTELVNHVSVDDARELKTGLGEVKADPATGMLSAFPVSEIIGFLVFALGLFIIYKRFVDRKNGKK